MALEIPSALTRDHRADRVILGFRGCSLFVRFLCEERRPFSGSWIGPRSASDARIPLRERESRRVEGKASTGWSHFDDLRAILGDPSPPEVGPEREWSVFERDASNTTRTEGRGDVSKRGHHGRRREQLE